ncbi:MAG: chlorite dismutase family protein [Dehalococcoidia bacterium]
MAEKVPGTARSFSAGLHPGPHRAVPREFTFVGGSTGPWQITRLSAVRGEGLLAAPHLVVFEGAAPVPRSAEAVWVLRGVTSNERYTTSAEHEALTARQPELGRPEATEAALIPIRKVDTWWALSQDERRAIFEERSKHVATSLAYLPAVARRLHHGRDLGEPFDFLTWFEYAPRDAAAFEELVGRLRTTEEWSYVEREVDIRLTRADTELAPRPN